MAPRIWKGAGIGALVVLIGATWLLRETRPKRVESGRATAQHAPKPRPTSPVDTVASSASSDAPDTTPLPKEIMTANSDRVRPAASPDTMEVSPSGTAMPVPAPASSSPEAAMAGAARAATPSPRPKARSSARWVSSVSRGWVVVRAGPGKGTRLVASIGPHSRVQLGESQGTWRRIKARGFSGWVEQGSLFVETPSTRSPVVVSRGATPR